MAISYFFEVSINSKPEEILQIIFNQFGFEWQDGRLRSGNVLIYAHEQDDDDIALSESDLGFRPNIIIGFRVKPKDDLEVSVGTVLKVSLFILDQTSGNGVLLNNGEVVVFQRISGRLLFNNEEWNSWTEAVLSNRKIAYERQTIPPPFAQ